MRHFKYGDGNSITVKSPSGEKIFNDVTDFFIESPGSGGSRTLSGVPVFIGCGIHEPGVWDDFAGLDIKGKPVFMMQFYPPKINGQYVLPKELRQKYAYGFPSLYKYPALLERGAACIIHVLNGMQMEKWERFKAQAHLFSIRPLPPHGAEWQVAPPVPEIVASQAMVDYFFKDKRFDPIRQEGPYERFEFDGFKMTIRLDVTEERITSDNVIGFVRGSDPELKNTYIALGAHLDHLGIYQGQVFNGANDDASGCAVLLKIAEEIAKHPPKRSLIFTFFTGEETALNGSMYFVENCPVPLKQLITYINMDEVGGRKGNDSQTCIVASALPAIDIRLENTLKAAGKHLGRGELKIERAERKPYQIDWVDYYSFLKKGIPIISIGATPDSGDDWHTPGDDVEKIDFEFLGRFTKYIHELVLDLASAAQ